MPLKKIYNAFTNAAGTTIVLSNPTWVLNAVSVYANQITLGASVGDTMAIQIFDAGNSIFNIDITNPTSSVYNSPYIQLMNLSNIDYPGNGNLSFQTTYVGSSGYFVYSFIYTDYSV